MATLYPVAGAAIAVAGADKLVGNRGYASMFRHLGWSDDAMRAAAAAEVIGGALMVPRATRRLGGLIVAAVSAAVLLSEINEGDGKLAASRGAVLLAGLGAAFAPGEKK